MIDFINSHMPSVGKTIVIYFFLIAIMRIMGKREMAQISVFDIIVFFVISELLSLSINSKDSGLWDAIIPILVIVALELITSKIVLRWKRYRTLIEGEISYIIYNGIIDQKEMHRQRYNLDDLFTELRGNNVSSPKDVQFAILEPKGKLNIITYKDSKVVYPDLLINDGVINKKGLEKLGKNIDWLEEEIKKYGYKNTRDIFLCLYESGGLNLIPREKAEKSN